MTNDVEQVPAWGVALLAEVEALRQRVRRIERRQASISGYWVRKCPDCGAEPGEACVSMTGKRQGQAHRARKEAVHGR
jgi:hypothetical protein